MRKTIKSDSEMHKKSVGLRLIYEECDTFHPLVSSMLLGPALTAHCKPCLQRSMDHCVLDVQMFIFGHGLKACLALSTT